MPTNISGTALTFNTPNYAGELYSLTPTETPFLALLGGSRVTTGNFEFPVGSTYSHPDPKQPAITEQQSLTAPQALTFVRDQLKNVTQIFHDTISVSYQNMSNMNRLEGINTAGTSNNAPSELDFQIQRTLEKQARDIEWTFINGVYQTATGSNVANKTRGILEACGLAVDAADAPVTRELITSTLKEAWKNNSDFSSMILMVNATQKVALTEAFKEVTGFVLPPSRSVGGLNITRIATDFGEFDIVMNRYMPSDVIAGIDMSVVRSVEQPIPGKGNFFMEELGIKGGGTDYQIFGQIGLDHGPGFRHFKIEKLAV